MDKERKTRKELVARWMVIAAASFHLPVVYLLLASGPHVLHEIVLPDVFGGLFAGFILLCIIGIVMLTRMSRNHRVIWLGYLDLFMVFCSYLLIPMT